MSRSKLSILALACVVGGAANASAAMYSTGFEDFTVGAMSSGGTTQNGWSGGAQADFTNNDTGVDNGDGTFGDEAITTAAAHSGTQSWRYSRGYNSPGQGTPYSPTLSGGVFNDGDMFLTTIWFKPVLAGDNSGLAIETGNAAGDDRANILAYIDNTASGLTIRSFTGANFDSVALYSGVDANVWHSLDFTMTKSGFVDQMTVSLDGGAVQNYTGSLNEWRDSLGFGYSDSSRLKLRTRHLDGDTSFKGFYLDDITVATQAVPEPASMVALGVGALALIRKRRSQKG